MKLRRAAMVFLVAVFYGSWQSPAMSSPRPVIGQAIPGPLQYAAGRVPNIFANARGLVLDTRGIDRYIAPSITGSDRVLARNLMALMPSNQRGDFIYFGPNRRLLSNNPAILPYATIRYGKDMPRPTIANDPTHSTTSYGRVRPFDYSSTCSPPNPVSGGGPYVRQVSKCGFTTGWAFVNLKCGTTISYNGDSGHLYFELQGTGIGSKSKSAIEGGLEYYGESDIAPYLRRAVNGVKGYYESLTNGTARYSCDENLMIVHGATLFRDPNTFNVETFTEVGALPTSYDPQTVWLDHQEVTLDNPAWLFGPGYNDISGGDGNSDPAGYQTPCSGCSISQVTSIAQPNGDDPDGSTFGRSADGFDNTINWMQVAFGNWGSDCVPGAPVCTIFVAADPTAYYGGPQYYPDDTISQSNYFLTGYGPYETFDGIYYPLLGTPPQRSAEAQFLEPLPPLPCTVDGNGLCGAFSSFVNTEVNCLDRFGHEAQVASKEQDWYQIYSDRTQIEIASETTTWQVTLHTCARVQTGQTWSPREPKIQYGDATLP